MDRVQVIPILLFAFGGIVLAWGLGSEKVHRAASAMLLQLECSPVAPYLPALKPCQ